MKLNKVVFVLIITSIFLMSTFSIANASVAKSTDDYTVTSANQCTTPTASLFIEGHAVDTYNVTSFHADQGACLAVHFSNTDTIDHSFTIDANSTASIAFFTIYLKAGASKTVNFQVPKDNIAIKYYCAVPGHEKNGMFGTLYVGTASAPTSKAKSSPGFEMMSVFIGLIAAVGLVGLTRKRRN